MHYSGHLREAFCDWLDEDCPPAASVEVNYKPQRWPSEQLLRKMLACSDVMPRADYEEVVGWFGLDRSRRQTYGSVARALLDQQR